MEQPTVGEEAAINHVIAIAYTVGEEAERFHSLSKHNTLHIHPSGSITAFASTFFTAEVYGASRIASAPYATWPYLLF